MFNLCVIPSLQQFMSHIFLRIPHTLFSSTILSSFIVIFFMYKNILPGLQTATNIVNIFLLQKTKSK